jgi:hypothetical protein
MRTAIIVTTATLALLAGCGPGTSSNQAASTGTPSTTVSPSSAATPPPCPNPEGQACLGKLEAGTYDTVLFVPSLEYTVPSGWANYEDEPGNFLLVPPHGTLRGVNAATSDFIGVYTSVLAHANACPSVQAPGVGRTPAAIMRWLERDPAFRAGPPQSVTIGGRHGLMTTLRMAPSWTMTCHYSHGSPIAPLIVGSVSSFLDHNLIPGQATRLYLLANDDATGASAALAIEVVDIEDAGHLAAYSKLVEQFTFDT